MLAKALTVSFALAAVWAQLALADEKREFRYTCDLFENYLSDKKGSRREFYGEMPAITLNAIRNVDKDGCKIPVYLAIVLGSECKISQYDGSLKHQMAHYVKVCTSTQYWNEYPILFKSIGDEPQLDHVFDESFFQVHRGNWLFERGTKEMNTMLSNISKKYGSVDPEAHVIQPCEEFISGHQTRQKWIDRALSVVSGEGSHLESISPAIRKEQLQLEICKIILKTPEEFITNVELSAL